MRIAVVAEHACIRCSQTSLAVQKFGHEVHMVLHPNSALRQLNEKFASTHVWFTKDQLLKEIEQVKPDIIHVHDRPHILAVDLIEANLGIPIVNDIHDLDSMLRMQMGPPTAEAKALLESSGLVFVSQPCLDYAKRWYKGLPPSIVVHSTACHALMPSRRLPYVGGAVWEGGLYPEPPDSPRRYIDQIGIVQSFAEQEQAVFLHPAPEGWPDNAKPYAAHGAIVAPPMPYVPLLKTLTRYDFGWYGQTEDAAQIHNTLPNKLFDYVAAGLPVLVIRAEEAGRFVTENRLGLSIDEPSQLRLVKKDLLAMRDDVWQRRHEFTREQSIQPLLKLYESLVSGGAKEKESHAATQRELRDGEHPGPGALGAHNRLESFHVSHPHGPKRRERTASFQPAGVS